MSTASSTDFLLAAGESLHLPVAAGSVLLLAQGRVRIDESPRWLAERMVPVGSTVDEGQPYAVDQAGWIRVTALGAAGARLRPLPAALPAARPPWWHVLLQRLGA